MTKQTKADPMPKKSIVKSRDGKSEGNKGKDVTDKGPKLSGQSKRGKSGQGNVVNVNKDDSEE